MSSVPEDSHFVCPECGGSNCATMIMHVSTVPDENDPWSMVLKTVKCGQCSSIIPAHLAELWDDISINEAKKEWCDIYKKSMPNN